jgi:glycogen debranching enzyme
MTTHEELWKLGIRTIQELETDKGILASGRNELFGCIFGRDSLITSMLLLEVYEKTQDAYFLTLVRKILVNLAKLQGREVNIESGEEPGKMIHEFRPDNHAHLTSDLNHPWYLYPDGIMRNYDTVDATPLFLMACARYYQHAHDHEFISLLEANIRDALAWILSYGDGNGDCLIDYQFHPDRKSGGLRTQSWMDSGESVFFENTYEQPTYRIAPIEVQAYAYAALQSWGTYFAEKDPEFARSLRERAVDLKNCFNKRFVHDSEHGIQIAYAIDGAGKPLTATRSSFGHALWACAIDPETGVRDSIVSEEHIPAFVARLMEPDLFVPEAGIRTLSSDSSHYEPNSYHNGSIWPHDTGLIALGLKSMGYEPEFQRIRESLLKAYEHFQTPLELFVYDGELKDYVSDHGQKACQTQAWSAAALLALLA